MDFYLNGQKLDITLEDEKTVGDVLKSFEQTAIENNSATVGVQVDGKQINAEDFDKVVAQELKENTRIDVRVVTQDSVLEAFKVSANDIKDTVEQLMQVPALLQSGSDSKANAAITRLADVVDNFCHVTALSSLFPQKFGEIRVEGKNLSEFFADFMPVFNDLNGALENGDTVLLGDLAEYEISPRLQSLAAAVKEL